MDDLGLRPIIELLATDHAAKAEVHVNPGDADRYESLVVQRVLSTQVALPEKNQRHTLFHTKGVVQERSICIIIDSGSCNNLASTILVEKLSLPTRKHPNPYHIQWLNDGGKIKITRSMRVPFSMPIIFLGNICTKEQTTVLSDTHQRLAYRHIVTFLHQTILDITT